MVSGSRSTSGPYDVSTGLELAEALGSFPWRQKGRRAVVRAYSGSTLARCHIVSARPLCPF